MIMSGAACPANQVWHPLNYAARPPQFATEYDNKLRGRIDRTTYDQFINNINVKTAELWQRMTGGMVKPIGIIMMVAGLITVGVGGFLGVQQASQDKPGEESSGIKANIFCWVGGFALLFIGSIFIFVDSSKKVKAFNEIGIMASARCRRFSDNHHGAGVTAQVAFDTVLTHHRGHHGGGHHGHHGHRRGGHTTALQIPKLVIDLFEPRQYSQQPQQPPPAYAPNHGAASAPSTSGVRSCPMCQSPVPNDSQFCGKCGTAC